jgi:8-oxo-dGTP pyrophosphatase MutT (NUDIX family)
MAPAATPVQHAKHPLAGQFMKTGAGQRPEMGVGEMGEHKHGSLNSSLPPPVEGKARGFALRRLVPRLFHGWARIRRGLTLGVKAVVRNEAGEILLLRHSYVPGWHLPGGGVEPGETALEALARELMEEAAVEILAPPRLHGLLLNANLAGRDHVAVYVIEHFRAGTANVPNREILEIGFFASDALPEGTTAATRRRLMEVREGRAAAAQW